MSSPRFVVVVSIAMAFSDLLHSCTNESDRCFDEINANWLLESKSIRVCRNTDGEVCRLLLAVFCEHRFIESTSARYVHNFPGNSNFQLKFL